MLGFRMKLIDVSALVHTGMNSPYYKDLTYYNMPVGGLIYLNRYISEAIDSKQPFVLAFDSHSTKCADDNGYKAGRPKAPAVYAQIEFAYNFLQNCNILCAKHEGYEADDIIDWYAQEYHDEFTYYSIIGNDVDLAHSLWPNGELCPCSSQGKFVNYNNFETGVIPGKVILYNTISLYKIICGCASDNISSIGISQPYKLYRDFCTYLVQNGIFSYETTAENAELLINVLTSWDSSLPMQDIKRNQQLVLPSKRPEGLSLFVPSYDVDLDAYATYLSLINDKKTLKALRLVPKVLTDEQKDIMKDAGKSVASGTYAVDRNINPDAYTVQDICLFGRDF